VKLISAGRNDSGRLEVDVVEKLCERIGLLLKLLGVKVVESKFTEDAEEKLIS